jgi:hypothetical protein
MRYVDICLSIFQYMQNHYILSQVAQFVCISIYVFIVGHKHTRTQPHSVLSDYVPEARSSKVNRPEHKANHSFLTSVAVQNVWS